MSSNSPLPKFNLNLSLVSKNANKISDELLDDLPPIPTNDDKMAETVQPKRQRPTPVRASMAMTKKNLVVNHSSDSSDVDLDLDLAQIPVGKDDDIDTKDSPVDTPGPVMQVAQLPDLEDDDDDEGAGQEKNKLSLLYDLLLTPDQCDEPPDEWTYKSFIKDFAKSEAAEDNDDDYDDGEEEYEEYDDDVE